MEGEEGLYISSSPRVSIFIALTLILVLEKGGILKQGPPRRRDRDSTRGSIFAISSSAWVSRVYYCISPLLLSYAHPRHVIDTWRAKYNEAVARNTRSPLLMYGLKRPENDIGTICLPFL